MICRQLEELSPAGHTTTHQDQSKVMQLLKTQVEEAIEARHRQHKVLLIVVDKPRKNPGRGVSDPTEYYFTLNDVKELVELQKELKEKLERRITLQQAYKKRHKKLLTQCEELGIQRDNVKPLANNVLEKMNGQVTETTVVSCIQEVYRVFLGHQDSQLNQLFNKLLLRGQALRQSLRKKIAEGTAPANNRKFVQRAPADIENIDPFISERFTLLANDFLGLDGIERAQYVYHEVQEWLENHLEELRREAEAEVSAASYSRSKEALAEIQIHTGKPSSAEKRSQVGC